MTMRLALSGAMPSISKRKKQKKEDKEEPLWFVHADLKWSPGHVQRPQPSG